MDIMKNLYGWPIEALSQHAEHLSTLDVNYIASSLRQAGYGESVLHFLIPLYLHFNGASLYHGALRIYPFAGDQEHGMPDLITWNAQQGWKQFEMSKSNQTFYFCSNLFGDLLGIPLSNGEIARDRVSILFTEQYMYREAGIEWKDFLSVFPTRPDLAEFFAKVERKQILEAELGRPARWQCFSSKVPEILGGPHTIENVLVVSLAVHVSFTLQVLKQSLAGNLTPGSPLGMVDLK